VEEENADFAARTSSLRGSLNAMRRGAQELGNQRFSDPSRSEVEKEGQTSLRAGLKSGLRKGTSARFERAVT